MGTDRDFIALPSGKRLSPNLGIVGIDHEGSVSEGCDGIIPIPADKEWSNSTLTAAECVELADVMLARWAEFREKHERPAVAKQHSPGPWTREFAKTAIQIKDRHGQCIATVHPGREQKSADADVIAAALDLLEALKACRGQWIHSVNAEKCLAALRKAAGRVDRPLHTTLCERCFPGWEDVEVLTVAPIRPCDACGAIDTGAGSDHHCHVFRSDPRPNLQER